MMTALALVPRAREHVGQAPAAGPLIAWSTVGGLVGAVTAITITHALGAPWVWIHLSALPGGLAGMYTGAMMDAAS